MRKLILFAVLIPAAAIGDSVFQFSQFGVGFINSTPATGFLQQDPGPSGLPNALTYSLPFATTQGDLILTDPNFDDVPMEILRFNGDGTVIFYAGNLPDSLAYTPSPPTALYDNIAIVSDIGPEATNSATYAPSVGQPGFDSSNPTYIFDNSDGSTVSTPEPTTFAMVAACLIFLAALRSGGYFRPPAALASAASFSRTRAPFRMSGSA